MAWVSCTYDVAIKLLSGGRHSHVSVVYEALKKVRYERDFSSNGTCWMEMKTTL